MKYRFRKWAAAAVSAAAILSNTLPAFADETPSGLIPLQIAEEDFEVDTPNVHTSSDPLENFDRTGQNEPVRVSVFLKDSPAIEAFDLSTLDADDPQILIYREQIEQEQERILEKIREALSLPDLECLQNLTLAVNAVSIEVKPDQIPVIQSVPGVEAVEIESMYEPQQDETQVPPTMITSKSVDGLASVWQDGFKGEGTRIAIIDTGLNTDHKSFDPDAYNEQIHRAAQLKNQTDSSYRTQMDLLDEAKIQEVIGSLHLAEDEEFQASDLYRNEKIPFAFNYVDKDLDVSHKNDSAGDHGSHVAGISAANELIPDGAGGFENASEVKKPFGAAPQAQVLVMKVFGKNGGSYASDYFAAIEDAVTLQCDAINLSIGTNNGGHSDPQQYQEAFEKLKSSKTVLTVSAGNNGTWANRTSLDGKLYGDDVSFDTLADPGSYTDSLTIGSIDNQKFTAPSITIGQTVVFYSDTGSKLPRLSALSGKFSYSYHPQTITGEESFISEWNLDGKAAIVSCARENADEVLTALKDRNPRAVILAVSDESKLPSNLEDYPIPVGLLSAGYASLFQTAGTANADSTEWTGELTLTEIDSWDLVGKETLKLSDFSSWGVPGSLQLKPEILTPGGYIYSVDGLDDSNSAYRNASGTSMAAPQAAGMSALLSQYIEENSLASKTGLSVRQLSQALLMSTAKPLKDTENPDEYYPVFAQGAGLAQIDKAIHAKSLITMEEGSSSGAADGKVKVELGEDAARNGNYSFRFTMQKVRNHNASYRISSVLFTQKKTEDGQYLTKETSSLDHSLHIRINGSESDTKTFSIGASGTQIEAEISLSSEQKNLLNDEYKKGAYIEGYLLIEPVSALQDVSYSIPVFGYYGSWSEPSMFEPVSYYDQSHGIYKESYTGVDEKDPTETNVLHALNQEDKEGRFLAGNPYLSEDTRDRERSAIKSSECINMWTYSLIRNSRISGGVIVDENSQVVETTSPIYGEYGAYFENNQWKSQMNNATFDENYELLEEGKTYAVSLLAIPEYYISADDLKDPDVLRKYALDSRIGNGAKLTTKVTVDNTAPRITGAAADPNARILELQMMDDQYMAYIAIYDESMTNKLYEGVPEDTVKGESFTQRFTDLNFKGGDRLKIVTGDYARNERTQTISIPNAVQYPVLMNLAHLRSNPQTDQIYQGEDLDITLQPDADYRLPDTIQVRCGSVTLNTDQYEWNSETGSLLIPSSVITGTIEITAQGVPIEHTIRFEQTGLQAVQPIKAQQNSRVVVNLQPETGYLLPESVSITNTSDQEINSASYSWNRYTGELIIKTGTLTEDLTVHAHGSIQVFDIEIKGTGIVESEKTSEYGSTFTATVEPQPGYSLPAAISITGADGSPLSASAYTWNSGSGLLEIRQVRQSMTVSCNAERIMDTITVTGSSFQPLAPVEAPRFSQVSLQIQPDEGYSLPETVAVKKGTEAVSPELYSWNPLTGQLILHKEAVSGDLTVEVICTENEKPKKTWSVSFSLEGFEDLQTFQIEEGNDLTLTLTPLEGFTLPESIQVKKGSAVLSASSYEWDSKTGTLKIYSSAIDANLEITAQANQLVQLDTTQLKAVLDKAKKIKRSEYEGSQFVQLDDLLNQAKSVYEHPETQQQINDAANSVNSELLKLRRLLERSQLSLI